MEWNRAGTAPAARSKNKKTADRLDAPRSTPVRGCCSLNRRLVKRGIVRQFQQIGCGPMPFYRSTESADRSTSSWPLASRNH